MLSDAPTAIWSVENGGLNQAMSWLFWAVVPLTANAKVCLVKGREAGDCN